MPTTIESLAAEICGYTGRPIRLMEVCGTHTAAISKQGVASLLPEQVRLVSGPGCPVCVTPIEIIDQAVEIASRRR